MPAGKHIFLSGFMGSGKSTHGKKLAGLLKLPFVDLDLYIQTKENKTVQFIFDNEGEEHFRELETKYLKELITLEPHVISLGGGTVCFNNNLELVKNNGLLIYIEMSAEMLAERLQKSKQKRPLLKPVPSENLNKFIEEKLRERNGFYNQAHIKMSGFNLNHLQLHHLIIELKKQNTKI
jgi:shikimate kinase